MQTAREKRGVGKEGKNKRRKEGLERLELQNDDSMRHLHYGSSSAESTTIRFVDFYYIVSFFGINLRFFMDQGGAWP